MLCASSALLSALVCHCRFTRSLTWYLDCDFVSISLLLCVNLYGIARISRASSPDNNQRSRTHCTQSVYELSGRLCQFIFWFFLLGSFLRLHLMNPLEWFGRRVFANSIASFHDMIRCMVNRTLAFNAPDLLHSWIATPKIQFIYAKSRQKWKRKQVTVRRRPTTE